MCNDGKFYYILFKFEVIVITTKIRRIIVKISQFK